MTTTMSDTRVFELIAAYGASPVRWPAEERAAALARLEADPEVFATALAEAQTLDAAFDEMPDPVLPPELIAGVLAAAPVRETGRQRTGAPGVSLWPWRGWFAGAALACLSLGLMTGYFAPVDISEPSSDADTAMIHALTGGDLTEFDEEFGQ